MGHPAPWKREFEEVIMVEVLIGEMFGSDRSRPIDYERAAVVDAQAQRKRNRTLFEVNGDVCSKRV